MAAVVGRACVIGHAWSCARSVAHGRARSVVRGGACVVGHAWSSVVVRGSAWLCVVVRGGRAWSCVVVRGPSCVFVRLLDRPSTAVLPASRPITAHRLVYTAARTNEQHIITP